MNKRRWWIFASVPVILAICGFVALGVAPAPGGLPDPALQVGALPKYDAPYPVINFPPTNETAANPITLDKKELGGLLFFDPILSGNHDVACASCHQPDLGFGDGEKLHAGLDGKPLARHVPSLYEVAYRTSLFWDGRAETPEKQSLVPMLAANEMAGNPAQILADLQANAEYRALFARAFPADPQPISLQNVSAALASFERDLITHNTPFDQYTRGDTTALSDSQKRGFALFRSPQTNCYQCHAAPLFSTGGFAATGAGNGADAGREGAFAIPTLRNAALSAPYMHDGSLATLGDVIDFYARGGGAAKNKSPLLHPFELNASEKQDLLNFLYALTDETAKPPVPDRVPSGLAVIAPAANPIRQTVALANSGAVAATPNSIQALVDAASPGAVVHIPFGVYHETVIVDKPNITLRGQPSTNGDLPVLDGELQRGLALAATGDGFVAEQLAIKNYTSAGIFVDGASDVVVRDVQMDTLGQYGAYIIKSTNVAMERVTVKNVRGAGVYAGQSRQVVIQNNIVQNSDAGVELKNSIGASVRANTFVGNSPNRDVVWDAAHWDATFDNLGAATSPTVLPSSSWPEFARRGFGKIVGWLYAKH